MRFLPTITLDAGSLSALRQGTLRLQRGQWVKIAPNDARSKPSRFVAVRRGYLDIVHPDGPLASGTVQLARFKARCTVSETVKA